MDLHAYARAIRYHDWSCGMSDDGSAVRRGRARRQKLSALASSSKNHEKLWALGSAWHGSFTWRKPSEYKPESKRHEDGWRWVGAYCWVHGVRLSEDEAKSLVEPLGSLSDRGHYLAGIPKWGEIDARIKAVSA